MLMMFYMNVFLIYNIETSCWTIQNMGWSSVFGLPNLCATMFTCRCWYNDHNTKDSGILSHEIPSWISLHIELCCLWVICLFTIPKIYYDDTLGAFLWGNLDHNQWSKITHMVHQRNRWICDQRGFISSFDEPCEWSWITDYDPDYPKGMHPECHHNRF